MSKATKTAAELEAMILSRMQTLSECPPGMTVTVKRHGETWEALMMSPNNISYADCVARVTRYASAQNSTAGKANAKPSRGGFRAMTRGFAEFLAQTIRRPLSENELGAVLSLAF